MIYTEDQIVKVNGRARRNPAANEPDFRLSEVPTIKSGKSPAVDDASTAAALDKVSQMPY